MSKCFWRKLKKPIIGLSPMDGVTDQAFRHITKTYGNPDVIYTEFTSVEGLCHGATQLLRPLIYDNSQRPIIAQIFGKTPKYFRQVAVLLCELGFDGIDINMGCPAKSVAQHGSGAALIRTPKLAQEIILASKAGVKDYQNGKKSKDCTDLKKLLDNKKLKFINKKPKSIPISIKTRIGFDRSEVETWIPALLETEPAVITLHGRTLKQQYSGKADWDEIARAAEITHQTEALIIGNGDVKNRAEAERKTKKYKVDGVLIGRAALGNPLVFSKQNNLSPQGRENLDETKRDQIREGRNQIGEVKLAEIALEHARLFEKTYSQDKRYNFLPMRKHLAWYIKSIENAKEIRMELMQTNNSEEIKEIFKKYKLI
ncbi:MAG: tRNA-dihydrouridine synthase [Patescibacteria group bacterium]